MLQFIRKRWADVLIGFILLLMIIPTTRKPIQIYIQKLIATSPKVNTESASNQLKNYDLKFADHQGNVYSLGNSRNKVMVVNFWATWCPPCIAEMPMFQALYNDYGERVDFYFITQDDWSLIDQFLENRDLQLPVYTLINSSSSLEYTSLPTTYVIDKKGRILIEKVGVANWNSKDVRSLLDSALKY